MYDNEGRILKEVCVHTWHLPANLSASEFKGQGKDGKVHVSARDDTTVKLTLVRAVLLR